MKRQTKNSIDSQHQDISQEVSVRNVELPNFTSTLLKIIQAVIRYDTIVEFNVDSDFVSANE